VPTLPGRPKESTVSLTHQPATRPAPQPPSAGPARPGPHQGRPVIRIRITPGGYLLAVAAVAFGALALPAVAPGRGTAAYLAATAALVVALLGSLIGHELGHALVARRYGGSGMVTVGFPRGARPGRDDLPSARAQWRVAAAGPAASLLLAAVAVAAGAAAGSLGVFAPASGALPFAVLATVAWINGLVAVTTLVPGPGLDGGRIVRALAWARSGDPRRASLVAARAGQITGAALAAAGVATAAAGWLAGLWLALLGLLMIAAARSEAGQAALAGALNGRAVRDVLPPPGTPVPQARGWQTVQSLLDEAAAGTGQPAGAPGTTAWPVRDFDGQLAGLVTLSQLRAVPAGQRPATRVAQAATRVEHVTVTTPDEPLPELYARLSRRPAARTATPAALLTAGHALVLGPDGELAGVITPAALARAAMPG
jgi:Zn-dependent protease